jgi:hypothetical protein
MFVTPQAKAQMSVYTMIQPCSQKYRRMLVFKKYFHFITCSQIWINLSANHHHHFGYYITKLAQKTLETSEKKESCDLLKGFFIPILDASHKAH